jgi:hypothetical protein
MHIIESNTFLDEVSTDVFLIKQHELIFIAAKGLLWTI